MRSSTLWLDQLEQNHIPNVGTLCTLVASHQTLPSKGDVGETWINEAKKVLEDSEQKWRLPAHEFTETVHRLRSLPIQQALNLVKAIDRFFAMQDFHTEANARRKSKESNPTLLYIQAKDGGSPKVVETLPYIPTEDGGRHEVVETLPYIPTEEVQEHIGFPLVPGALADQDGHTNQEGFDLLQ